MERTNTGVRIPTIASDYQGVRRPHKYEGETREDRLKRIVKNFVSLYNQQTSEKLDNNSRGVVVIQQGYPPFHQELAFAPKPDGRENRQIIIMMKVQKGFSTVMFSGCYFLKEGKLRKVIDAEMVLKDREASRVAKRFLQKPVYKGIYSVVFSAGLVRPCRVYAAGDEILLMNLCNGLIFKVKKDEFAMQKLDEERFSLGTMHFRRVFDGEGMSFQRY